MAEKTSKAPQGSSRGVGPILVAVDFAPDSAAALLWACTYADVVNARIVVLHVVHDPGDAPGSYMKSDEDVLRPMEDVAGEMLDRFLEELKAEHAELGALENVEKVLVKGIPATRILEIAEARRARLIVMGSRGRTGLPHLLLGSKAERVVQMSSIPVTIVKTDKNQKNQKNQKSRN